MGMSRRLLYVLTPTGPSGDGSRVNRYAEKRQVPVNTQTKMTPPKENVKLDQLGNSHESASVG